MPPSRHIVYHKFAGSDYSGAACTETGGCGGHAYSADGGITWRAGPTAYNSTIAYADGPTQPYLSRQRPHVVLDPRTRELVALSTGVTVCAVPNCTASDVSTVTPCPHGLCATLSDWLLCARPDE